MQQEVTTKYDTGLSRVIPVWTFIVVKVNSFVQCSVQPLNKLNELPLNPYID